MSVATLRVKIKSLAAEAKIIRHEEQKFPTRTQRRLETAGYTDEQSNRILRRAVKRMNHALRRSIKDGVKRDHPEYVSLHFHRTVEVRSAARAALLAYGMMRGREYLHIEKKCYNPPDWIKVRENLATFAAMSKHDAEKRVLLWKPEEQKPSQGEAP
jgi:hypothetical protein